MFKSFVLSIALLSSMTAHALEKDYQVKWCADHNGYIPKTALEDGTFPDCITDDYAVEFDFGHKWAESIGQALNYAMYTGRKAAVVLIIETSSDANGVRRFRRIVSHYGGNVPVELLDVIAPTALQQ